MLEKVHKSHPRDFFFQGKSHPRDKDCRVCVTSKWNFSV